VITKLLTIGAGIVSLVMALIGYGTQREKSKEKTRKLTAKQAAIEAANQAEEQANEDIAKHRPNIPKRDYFRVRNK